MTGAHGVAAWSSPAWQAEATAWAEDRLAEAGLVRAGSLVAHSVRPWGAVLRVPIAGGAVWMKATAPTTAFEVGLYTVLTRVVPDRVLAPLAADTGRGWLLLPDGGPTLGERAEGGELVTALAGVLPRYARLQRDLAPHADELLGLGVVDMSPAVMPARFDEALAAVRVHATGGAAEDDAIARVASLRDTVLRWCELLARSPVPASVDHNDLHPWNVLGDAAGVRFYDWGDAVLAHPFASMLALGWVAMPGEALPRLRDAYLEPFADLAPHAELVETLELACRVGKIARALTWHRAISAGGDEEVETRWRTGPGESLYSLLDDSWLGRA